MCGLGVLRESDWAELMGLFWVDGYICVCVCVLPDERIGRERIGV